MMTEKKAPNKSKIVDWKKKSASDSDRLLTRRKEKDEPQKKSRPPRATGKPLLRLKKKIKEIYEDDDYDEEEDLINTPLYHITLIEDQEQYEKKETELLKITKQQELTSKLNIIMNNALASQKAGLKAEIDANDLQLANTPELTFKEVQTKAVKKKLTKPLDIQEDTDFVADETDKDKLAKIVLEKSGIKKRKNKKSIAEIAKELNRFKDYDNEATDEKQKD
jgi:hypothetical protein